MRKGFILSSFLVVFSLLLPPGEAHARRTAASVFKGKVIITNKRAPTRYSSENSFIRFLKKNRIKSIWPDKKKKGEWRFEFLAFFARPLNDLEATVKFYDITEGKKFIAADTVYTERGQRILASSMVLDKPRFSVNRKYMMFVVTARNVVIASTMFWLRGKAEQYSGKVTFTDEETR